MGGVCLARLLLKAYPPRLLRPRIQSRILPLTTASTADTDRPRHTDSKPMKVEFLSSPSANKDARQALQTSNVLFLTTLTDGSVVVGDRGQQCFVVLDDMPTRTDLNSIRDLLNSARMSAESRYLGEPDARALARDLRDSRRPPPTTSPRGRPQAISIDY